MRILFAEVQAHSVVWTGDRVINIGISIKWSTYLNHTSMMECISNRGTAVRFSDSCSCICQISNVELSVNPICRYYFFAHDMRYIEY